MGCQLWLIIGDLIKDIIPGQVYPLCKVLRSISCSSNNKIRYHEEHFECMTITETPLLPNTKCDVSARFNVKRSKIW